MIHYLVTREHPYTINEYLAGWAPELREHVRVIFYDEIAIAAALDRGAYIFSDLERLNPAWLELARRAWNALGAAGDCVLLNNPHRVMRREEMLRELHRVGRNPFRVFGVNENWPDVKLPAFVRTHNAHDGAMTQLLDSVECVKQALAKVGEDGLDERDLLIVEFCDTRNADGLCRKYGAFRVGERIIPRHILFSRDWMVKYPDHVDAATVEEERKYLAENPHDEELRRIFEFARIDYGRIDYGVLDGKLVTWEINTNPTIAVPRERLAESRKALQPMFMKPFAEAMIALEEPRSRDAVPFAIPGELLGRLKMRRGDQIYRAARKTAGRVLRRLGLRGKGRG